MSFGFRALSAGCRPGAASNNAGLREYVLQFVGRIPVSTAELYDRVTAEFGDVHKRAFYYCLSGLTAQGFLIRSGVRHEGFHYRLPGPKDPEPLSPEDRRIKGRYVFRNQWVYAPQEQSR